MQPLWAEGARDGRAPSVTIDIPVRTSSRRRTGGVAIAFVVVVAGTSWWCGAAESAPLDADVVGQAPPRDAGASDGPLGAGDAFQRDERYQRGGEGDRGGDGGEGEPDAGGGAGDSVVHPPGDGTAANTRPPDTARLSSASTGITATQDAGASDPTSRNQSVVVARRIPEGAPREDVTAAATVLDPADSPRARDDLGTLLLEVPGANVTRRGGFGSFATISLRGANPDEVRIYVDGVPVNQAVGGAVDLSTLPLGDVERIEVYRGSSPIAFGESALGGIISISTRTPGAATATARIGGGSFRTTFADGTMGGTVGRLKVYAGVHAVRAVGDFPQAPVDVMGGYQPSTRENNDLVQADGVFRAVLSLPGRRELRAGVIGVARDKGVPAEENFHATAARLSTKRALVHLGYESRDDLGSSSRLRATVFASAMRDRFSDRIPEIVGAPTVTNDLTRAAGASAIAEKALGDWGRLTTVVEGRVENFLPRNELDALAPAGVLATRRAAVAGFELDARWPALKLDLLPSIRLELTRDVRTGRDSNLVLRTGSEPVDRLQPIVRLGLMRPLGGLLSLRANVGRYARVPSFVELYGYSSGVIGNAELRSERGWNADMGVVAARESRASALSTSATIFGAEVDDLIGWRTYSYQTRAENISHARIWGVETEARLRRQRFAALGQATLTDARELGDIAANRGHQIAHHPRYRGYGRGEWHQPLASLVATVWGDVDATAGNSYTANRYGRIPPRLLLGAGVAVEHPGTGLRLALSALNLTDTRVRDFPGYPLPGRSIFASLGWSSADPRTKKTQE